MNFDIDIYLPFVDGDDQSYTNMMKEHAEAEREFDPHISGPSRVNNFGQLKFAIRSIFYCLPWIRYVHLVFHNRGHVPQWLDQNHPKIKVHIHSDYFDPEIVLPTFSSFVIDTQIGRVPGLSEHIIYMEDDMFFCKPVPQDDFFSSDGKPLLDWIERKHSMRHWQSWEKFSQSSPDVMPTSWKFSNWIWKSKLGINNESEFRFFDDHRPFPFLKSIFDQTNSTFPELYKQSISVRFRRSNVLSLYAYLLGMPYKGLATRTRSWKLWFNDLPCAMPKVINRNVWYKPAVSKINNPSNMIYLFFAFKYLRRRIPFWPAPSLNLGYHQTGNLNDYTRFKNFDGDEPLRSQICKDIDGLMNRIFPEKSEFELN